MALRMTELGPERTGMGFAIDHAGNPHARVALEGDGTRTVTIAPAALRECRRLVDYQEEDDANQSHQTGLVPAQPGEPS